MPAGTQSQDLDDTSSNSGRPGLASSKRSRFDHHTRPTASAVVVCAILLALGSSSTRADDLEDAEKLYRTGQYEECNKAAILATSKGFRDERWSALRIETERARGRSKEALIATDEALQRFPWSVGIHWLGHQVYRENGRADDALSELAAIEALVRRMPNRYGGAESRLVLGRYLLYRGADAKKVLEQFYDVAKKLEPELVDNFLATAELALSKQDYALAAETLQKAPPTAAEDPAYHYLLARAFSNDDRAKSEKELEAALKINPSHVDSLLLVADHQIDGEKYAEAEATLKRIFAINPQEPRAWAYRAVLAHLMNNPKGEVDARTNALAPWTQNPEVDHIIGRELSAKYRFAEGSAAQRRALEIDPEYLPAKVQLCDDLLRLGQEEEGWQLADQILAKDGYNVVAYNLVTLHDRLAGFRTLEAEGLLLRMDPREADLYGQRALDLLKRAKKTLGEKYGVTFTEPVIVEIFPQRKEFAVRTFGLPGAEGFLGVCFGRVVTVNSPASQGETPSNWEAVVWHEFCHAVTLGKSRNKMPRWLSEGISVYEEEQENRTWAEALTPKFREMLLGKELTPLSKLSAAFLAPKSGAHLQFAYFESGLAIDFLVKRFGLSLLKDTLEDLAEGKPLNEVLPTRAKTSLDQLDRDFAEFAHKRASSVAPDLTWDDPELPPDADSKAISAWLETHPKSFTGLRRLAARLVAEQKWTEAKDALERLKRLYPEYVGTENAYMLLANIARRNSDSAGERQALEDLTSRAGSGDAGPAFLRLMELDEASGNWAGVASNAERFLGVNPLIPAPYRHLADAAEHLGKRAQAIAAYRALAKLDDSDPAGVHYHLAKLLHDDGKGDEARREVLKSLEEAPRFRDAHHLLLELVDPARPPTPPAETPKPATETPTPKPARSQ